MRTKENKKNGVILVLVVVILTAIFSISIGIFSVILNQVITSGTFGNSYISLYAADQELEQIFYRDRINHEFPTGTTNIAQTSALITSGGCMDAKIIKTGLPPPPANTIITTNGLNTACGSVTQQTTARSFEASY